MATTIPSFQYPTAQEIRDTYLRRLRLHAASNGITLNVLPGSADYYRADAWSKRLQVIIANGDVAKNALSLLRATGDDLILVCSQFGGTRLPATKSSGFIQIRTSIPTATVSIPQGYQCSGPNGHKYQTTAATIVTDKALVHVESLEAGIDKNMDVGDVVAWSSGAVPFLRSTATVDISGVDGGTDDEDLEELRQRTIEKLANPAAGGNWSQIRQWAEESSNAVRNAFVYAAARGPGTVDVAITGLTDDKTADSAVVTLVSNYIAQRLPGLADLNVTTITPEEVDSCYGAELTLPTAYGGAGGGWKDPSPWPTTPALITGYSLANQTIGVNTTNYPELGNHIGVWDPSDSTFHRYVVVAVSGSSGAYTLTLQGGITHTPATGQIVSCDAELMDEYLNTISLEFDKLGPGEKIDSADPGYVDVFPRARRMPVESVKDPQRVTNNIVAAVISNHDEMLDFQHNKTWATGDFATAVTSPSLQPTMADPPNALVLKNLGVYAL